MEHTPHIVVLGGGLAGTMLAARLCMEGKDVTLIDDFLPGSASSVAAGMFNVITGRFGAKTWMAETLMASLKDFLSVPAFQVLERHITWQHIYRPFRSVEEYNKWQSRQSEDGYAELIKFSEKPVLEEQIENPHGGIYILPCGWIAIGAFLEELKWILIRDMRMRLVREVLDYRQIDLPKRLIVLADDRLEFDRIVFCEGVRVKENPWFGGLPVIPNKGEILTIRTDLELPFILSGKAYMIPVGENRFVTGSTYFNDFDDHQPSARGLAEIRDKLSSTLKIPYEVEDHRSGLRPTTPDRRPIVGTHPDYSWVHVFTGFGTKGVLLAPHFSALLAREMNGEKNVLPEAVSPARF
ncbi:MAG: FAD-binding oxidoreductase [Bacteroidia bacterium]